MAEATTDTFVELVYADREARDWFAETWPDATFVDARDTVHDERFEVTIPGVTKDEVYPRIIAEGWGLVCLGLALIMRTPEQRDDVRRWIAAAKAGDIGSRSRPEVDQ